MAVPFRLLAVAFLVGFMPGVLSTRAIRADEPGGGVAIIPQDAAFVSATLRLREQWDRFAKSNAFAALKKLPAVQRAFDQIEEQKLQPGSPLSMFATFMELPENQQALELLDDMVSTDTFLYGEPSCVKFIELFQKVQRAQQAANILLMARSGEIGLDVDLDFEALDTDEDGAALPPRDARIQPVQMVRTAPDELASRMVLQTLADNIDLIVVPDLVWGFKTSKLPAAESQLKRIEVLVKLITQANPDLAKSLDRRKIAGGEVVTFTIDGATLPWDDMVREATEGMDGEALDKVLDRLRSLDLVISLGVVGDRVVFSIGDSADHLDKLATSGGKPGLAATQPFEPLMADKDKRITAVSYLSEAMAKVLAPSAADIEQLAELADTIAAEADLPEGAAAEARRSLETMAAGYKKRLPVPGPWMAYSFLADQGYEGYAWDWSRNRPFDGSKRLDLLEHTGGAPLGALVFRVKNDPEQFEDLVSWAGMAWTFFTKYVITKADEDDRERVELVEKHLGPLTDKLVATVRTKLLPALADGQIGLVLDAKSRTKRLQAGLPEAAEPLPLTEPAIVLGLDDPKLFREGLSDVFALGDELVDAVREIDPDSVPADYSIKDPEKTKVESGTVWSWALGATGLDDQIRPAIGVGEHVAVLSMVPKQATRLLADSKLETGSQLSKFEEPLAGAAALDVAGLVDAIQPWIVYLARLGCVQQQEGQIDREKVLTKDVENEQATDALAQVAVVCEVLKSLRVAVAEAAVKGDATVTHWRNVIRDLPAK
ncbi:MAG: hypothetical protein WCR51_11320 [Planctomycetia bacterium]